MALETWSEYGSFPFGFARGQDDIPLIGIALLFAVLPPRNERPFAPNPPWNMLLAVFEVLRNRRAIICTPVGILILLKNDFGDKRKFEGGFFNETLGKDRRMKGMVEFDYHPCYDQSRRYIRRMIC
ncbi:MAG: hypothetical protein DRI46_13545 [Chloroflexi bacterium]|nr:MAG: hypothetical protein DRI46_13545 [Chloroflexota bacterium]